MAFQVRRPPGYRRHTINQFPSRENFLQQNAVTHQPIRQVPHRQMTQQRSNNGSGNIISRLFQGKQERAAEPAAETRLSVGGFSNTLNNVQQVLNIVHQTAPIIQEYGPMVKNLPIMFRLMKAIKEPDEADNKGSVPAAAEAPAQATAPPNTKAEPVPAKQGNIKKNGLSNPKLYIPYNSFHAPN